MEFHSHSGLLSHGCIAAVFRDFRNPDLWHFDSTFPVDVVGYNFRMPNINASLGLAQIEQMNKILYLKKNIFKFYKKEFKKFKSLKILETDKKCLSNNWINLLYISNYSDSEINQIIKKIEKKNIFLKRMWSLVSENKSYTKYPSMNLSVSKELSKRIICLPSSPNMK